MKRAGLAQYLANHEFPNGIIICEEPKFIYMKSAKTAGTSILRGVLQNRLPDIFHFKDHPAAFQKWCETITDEDLDEYFIFSIVRNPWDRLVSIAAYFQIPFQKFIFNIHEYQKDYDIRVHSIPQHLYTHYHGVQFVDMIGRTESLQPDFNLICDKLGIERERLPITNRSIHKHYSRYYGAEERQIAAELYAGDIAYFGYMFEQQPKFRENMSMIWASYKSYLTNWRRNRRRIN